MLAKIKDFAKAAVSDVLNYANQKTANIPAPFLQRPVAGAVESGYYYSDEEARFNGTSRDHRALDFKAARDEEVRAAADGWAVASWEEWPVQDDFGRPHLIDGQPAWFGPGLFVQIWHPGKGYTQYCHLDGLAGIRFYDPRIESTDNGAAYRRNPIINAPVRSYRHPAALKVKAGQIIGYAGMTGCGLGGPSFPDWEAKGRYRTAYEPHLHFVVALRRAPYTRQSAGLIDPFGLYAELEAYPAAEADWSRRISGSRHHSLWLE